MEIPKENDKNLQILKIKKVRSIASKYEMPDRYKGRHNDPSN